MKQIMSKEMCGVYKITGPSGRVYVGQTKDLWSRWNDHVKALYFNEHTNPHLQNAWNVHGSKSFSFELIEEVTWCEETLDAREAFWGEKFRTLTDGYNIEPFNVPSSGGGNLFSKPRTATHPTTGYDIVIRLLQQEGKTSDEQ